MRHNTDNDNGGSDNEHAIATKPQDLLDFLGFISKGTLIAAVATAACKGAVEEAIKALDAGDAEGARKHLDAIRDAICLSGKATCTLGQTIVRHDEFISRKCRENGIEAKSQTPGHISAFKSDGEAFLRGFFEEAEQGSFAAGKPPKKVVPTPKRSDKPFDPDPDKHRFN